MNKNVSCGQLLLMNNLDYRQEDETTGCVFTFNFRLNKAPSYISHQGHLKENTPTDLVLHGFEVLGIVRDRFNKE